MKCVTEFRVRFYAQKLIVVARAPGPSPRCKVSNVSDVRFCRTCGLALDMKTALEARRADKLSDEFMDEFMARPEIQALVGAAREDRRGMVIGIDK